LTGLIATMAPTATATAASRHADGVIAYSVKTGIYAVHANGTGSRLLVPWQPSSCGSGCVVWKVPRNPRYSPDGRRLTYDLETNVVHKGVGSLQANTRTVYVADANGQHRRRLGLGHSPEFSADGNEVIYLRNPNAYPRQPNSEIEPPEPLGDDYGPMEAVNVLTGSRRRLPVPGAPEFSPDGKKMLMYRQVKLSDGFHWGDTVESLDGSEAQFYTLSMFYAEHPRFTANGELSYDCPSVHNTQPDICLFSPTSRHHRRLFHIHEFWALEAANSPSGRHFAISGLQGLYVTNAQGRNPRLIVRNGSGASYVDSDVPTSPTWQPVA
jgi:hypothetical protein